MVIGPLSLEMISMRIISSIPKLQAKPAFKPYWSIVHWINSSADWVSKLVEGIVMVQLYLTVIRIVYIKNTNKHFFMTKLKNQAWILKSFV